MNHRAKSLARATLGAALVCSLSACPNGQVVRPDDPTYVDAIGGTSTPVIEEHGEPLVVDWRPEHRGDLEVAMKEGVAVVSYTKQGMRLLKNCHSAGKYGFIGMTLKEQVISLVSASEIKANLPLSGVGLAGKLGGELERGTALNVAMAMVGKRKTTPEHVARQQLSGACEGATHFVRGATVGAFVMKTGARGRVSTAAEMFGVGATGETASEKDVMNKDGDLVACRGATADGEAPPSQCTALIRLELDKISEGAKAEAPPTGPVSSWAPNPCPAGMVMSAGKCAAPLAQRPHQCIPGDIQDCTAQCDRDQPDSCVNLGFAFERGQGAPKDVGRAVQLYQKACALGSPLGCHNHGFLLTEGEGIAHDPTAAASAWHKACAGGEARGCNSLGAAYFRASGVPEDPRRAGALFQRACNGGEPAGCTNLGSMHLTTLLGPKNPRAAAGLFQRACDGRDPAGCFSLASALETGTGVQQNLSRSVQLYEDACRHGYPLACYSLAVLAILGTGVDKDPGRAQGLLQQACNSHEVMACATLRVVHGQQTPLDPEQVALYRATYEETCAAGESADCTNLGLLLTAAGDASGRQLIQKGCSLGDAWGCQVHDTIQTP